MRIVVNGEERVVPDGITIKQLLQQLGLEGRPLAVEVNFEVVPRECHETHQLAENDRVEIVTLVGGG